MNSDEVARLYFQVFQIDQLVTGNFSDILHGKKIDFDII